MIGQELKNCLMLNSGLIGVRFKTGQNELDWLCLAGYLKRTAQLDNFTIINSVLQSNEVPQHSLLLPPFVKVGLY